MYKIIKPITAGTRALIALDRTTVYKGKPVKALTRALHVSAGRNNAGKITVRHKAGGHKKVYRLIAFKRQIGPEFEVVRTEYDPNRNCEIVLIKSKDQTCCYILGIEGLRIGS